MRCVSATAVWHSRRPLQQTWNLQPRCRRMQTRLLLLPGVPVSTYAFFARVQLSLHVDVRSARSFACQASRPQRRIHWRSNDGFTGEVNVARWLGRGGKAMWSRWEGVCTLRRRAKAGAQRDGGLALAVLSFPNSGEGGESMNPDRIWGERLRASGGPRKVKLFWPMGWCCETFSFGDLECAKNSSCY